MKKNNMLGGLLYEGREIKNAIHNHIRRMRCIPTLRTISLSITNKCNGRCSMCSIWKTYIDNPYLEDNELTLHEYQGFFSNKEFLKDLEFVYVSGGEPFLRKDLPYIISFVHECKPNCPVYVATNGFLEDRIVEYVGKILAFHDRFQIGVSLDGINEVHDKVRGVKGAFGKTVKTLFALRKNFPNLLIQVTMTVTSKNLKQIPKVHDFCKKNGFFFQVGLATSASYFSKKERNSPLSEVEVEELKTYFDSIERNLIREYGRMRTLSQIYWLDGSIRYLLNPTTQNVPCYSGLNSLYLDPYGTVYPCYSFFEEMGNIRKRSIRDIWFSRRAQEIREHIVSKSCPNCWIVHEASLSIKSDYFRKLRYIFK